MKERNKYQKIQLGLLVIGLLCVGITLIRGTWNFEAYFYFACGYFGATFLEWLGERARNPYRWACPTEGCQFEFKCNNADTSTFLKTDHRRIHLREAGMDS